MGVFVGAFFAYLILGVPIALVLGLAAASYLLFTDQAFLLAAFPQRLIAGIDQFVLLTVPLFILAGNLMNAGGISERIMAFCQGLVGRFRGGLSLVNITASMFFSGVSGSAVADASAIGTVLIPGMAKQGYPAAYAAALTATASVMGPIIPPSIAMVIFGALSGTSIGNLFIAGVLPGVFLGGLLMAYAAWVAHRAGYPKLAPMPMMQMLRATIESLPILLLPVVIIGGMLSGVFTPTEAAVIAVIYALIVSGILYRTLSLQAIYAALVDSAVMTAGLFLVVAMASMVTFVFGIEQIPERMTAALLALSDDPIVILLLINVVLLILGCFLDPVGAMIVTLPILLEVAKKVGIDLTHLGMIVVFNLSIGMITPPVGLCLFVVCSIGKLRLDQVVRPILPMLGVCIGALLVVTFMPELSLFLPRMLSR